MNPAKVLVKVYTPPPPALGAVSDERAPLKKRFQIEPIGGLGSHYDAFTKARAGARFIWDEKVWVADAEVAARIVGRLQAAGFSVILPVEVRAVMEAEVATVVASVEAAKARLLRLDEVLAKKGRALFDYQRRDVLWLSSRKRTINCSAQGTGKSAVSLAALPEADDVGVVVACPKIAKGVWRAETKKWREEFEVTTLEGRGSFRWPEPGEVVITNYDIIPPLKDLPPAPGGYSITLIGDEAHLLRNRKSQRTIRFERLAEVSDRVMLLTGTPLPSRPSELWSLMMLAGIAHEAFGTYKEFMRVFSGKKDFFGKVEWGDPLPESGECLERVLIRHLKSDALDLPPKIYGEVEVDIDAATKKILDKNPESKDLLKVKDISDIPFNRFSEIRKVLAHAKIEAAIELAESYEENETPVLFFGWHRAPIDAVGGRPGWGLINGDTSDKERERIASDFQAGRLKGVAATIQAAATAITLTRATCEVFIDRSYVPADNEQAEDRAHRIGTESPVTILHMVCDHPIDKHLQTLTSKKQGIIDGSVNTLAARKLKDISTEALIPTMPPKTLPTVNNLARRGAKSDAERKALRDVILMSGLAKPCPFKVMQMHLRTALDIATEAIGSDDTLTDAQWRSTLWLQKQYNSKLRPAKP